jgi:hypothetical protein
VSQAQVPRVVADYFGGMVDRGRHPVIVEAFIPGKGWRRHRSFRKRVSVSWARKLRAEGVTHVALASGARVADFRIEEVVR